MIYHLAEPADWEQAHDSGAYDSSTRGIRLEQQGFIHACKDHDQLKRVAQTIYADKPQLLLLTMDEEKLEAAGLEVRYEPGDSRDPNSEVFPHIYGGAIPLDLIECERYQA
ncbi:hypothetical protein BSZ39_07755 [Bowdeniella nasicola]|uniref:DUF952 domain-containing protein n=1 Tax=Bowdeniella nasicola TaxID=208480 RepID=A0A1Q5Q2C6_9ACTO|nr:DUF952 domain-containing protein [Bowdeniella nasicola]OKL53770.1 hypothetical protein BSZ39_07755 [Bowdeniella nasicola]